MHTSVERMSVWHSDVTAEGLDQTRDPVRD
jgi:hypothetical protein